MKEGAIRSEMMQNLFGDQSEEEEEIDSGHQSNPQPNYASDEREGGLEPEGEGEAEVEVHGEAEADSDGEQGDAELDPGESEGEREQSSQEVDVADPQEESEARDSDSDSKEGAHEERIATNRRRDVVDSGSEKSGEKHYESGDQEVDQDRSPRSPSEEKEEAQVAQSDVNIRNVFGSSDDEEADEYAQNDTEQDERRSPIGDEEDSEKDLRPDDLGLDDMIPEEDPRYESEDEHVEARYREKPVGPPLEVEIPICPPPVKMNMIKVSNIMGIDPKPFDAKTFVEEDKFVTEPGGKTRVRLVNNIVRHRFVKSRDGKTHSESNARFVRWSDGSLQLLIGNEVLDVTEQDAQQDHNHLCIKHQKGILQSQGKIRKKMRFIPSSIMSNSHRLLTAIVESRHRKAFKVKNCVTDIDPEREKEKREKAESQNLKASTKLSQAREKIKRKYPLPVERRQLSTEYLDEEDEEDHYGSHRSDRGFEEDLEAEAQRERRILNAKKSHKGMPGRSSMSSVRPSRRQMYSESEREESEYETEEEEEEEEEEKSPPRKRVKEPENEYEEDAEEDEEEEEEGKGNRYSEEDEEEEAEGYRAEKVRGSGGRKRKGIESDEEESPPRKAPNRRMIYDSEED